MHILCSKIKQDFVMPRRNSFDRQKSLAEITIVVRIPALCRAPGFEDQLRIGHFKTAYQRNPCVAFTCFI